MAWRVDAPEQETVETLRLTLGEEYIAAVPPEGLRRFLSQVRKHFYKRGEAIFHEDDLPGDVYIVATGHVKHRLVSPTGGEFTHKISPPGDFFGSFGAERRYGATQALTDCELLVVSRDEFLNFLSLTNDANAFLVRVQSKKAEFHVKRIYDLVFL